jgi:hypothetical protein
MKYIDGYCPHIPYIFIHPAEEVAVRVPKVLALILSKMAFAMSTINLLIYWVGLYPAPGNFVHFIYRCVEIKKRTLIG